MRLVFVFRLRAIVLRLVVTVSTLALLEIILGELIVFSALDSRNVVPDPALAQFI
jgi:hypothetical protein